MKFSFFEILLGQLHRLFYTKRFLALAITLALSALLTLTTVHTAFAQEDIIPENDFIDSPDEDLGLEEGMGTGNPGGMPGGNGAPGANFGTPPPSTDTGTPTFNPNNTPSFNSGRANPSFGGAKKRQRKAPPISQAGIEDITNENYPDLIDSFDFPNADIADVIKAISELTGKNFIVDPNVSGKITIMAPTQITVAEAYKVFLSALAIRSFTVVPSGKFLKILPVRDAQRDNLEIFSGNYTPDTDQMITRIIHLKYIPASEMNKFVSKLVSKNGNIDIYEPTNSLIVSDQASSVQRLIKITNQLDVAGFDEQIVVIPIRFAKAKDIADLIDQIINKGQGKKSGSGFSSGIPRFRPGGQSGGSSGSAFSTVIPDDRTNAIIVVGNKTGIEKIRKLVRTLDFKLNPEDQAGAYVYYVKYGEAKKIADILNGITKQLKDDEKKAQGSGANFPPPPTFGDGFGGPMVPGTPASSGSSGLFGGDVKISADEDTNSLIIVGSKQDYQGVLSLLKKVDIPRDQVYVEAIIMETTAQNSDLYGLSYFNFKDGTQGAGRVGFGGAKLDDILNVGTPGAILGFASGDTVKIKVGGQDVEVKSFLGFLNLLKATVNVDILSTPQVIALDNEEATIEVGENVPIGKTQSATATGTTTATDRADATIKLVIKPFISPSSEAVRLKIKQTIKQVSPQQPKGKLGEDAASLINRSVETNIVVRDGDTAVIGGLMRDQESLTETKVPLLGDIPVLGWLFKSSQTQKEKVNLLVFLSPKILRNPDDSNQLLTKKLNERIKFAKETLGGRDRNGAFAENLRPKLKKKATTEKIEDEFIDKEAQ